MTTLEDRSPRQARIAELRYLAGMTLDETAEQLGISRTLVKRFADRGVRASGGERLEGSLFRYWAERVPDLLEAFAAQAD